MTQPVYTQSGGAIVPQYGAAPDTSTPRPATYTAPPAAPVVTPTLQNPDGSPNTQAGAGAAPTIGSAYGGISATDTGLNTTRDYYKTIADQPLDEGAIRDAVTKRLQAEIDATNNVYNQKLNEAKVAGENRLGTTAAINARSGLLGSDFGAAHTSDVTTQNSGIYSGIGAEREAAMAAITTKGSNAATAEITAKRQAQQQGADQYIKFLTASTERQGTRTDSAAKAALAGGLDLSTDKDNLKAIADAYQIDPNALVASFVAAKNAQATAQKANTIEAPVTSSVLQPDGKGGYTTVQKGQATPDSALKEYQYAVQNDGYTGSLADWNSQKANQKVSEGVTRSPIDGSATFYKRTGPSVAGLPAAKSTQATSAGSTTLPTNTASSGTVAVPAKGTITNPIDKLSGSDLAYAQSGNPTQAKFKYPTQVDAAAKRIQAAIPGWSPASAAAQYAFFKSPETQKFIANSNTVLATINDPQTGIKALSDKVDRSNIIPLNNGTLSLKRATSDPATAKFVQQANILADEIGKILGSGAGSDFTIQLGQTLVNPAYSKSTFNATMDNLDARVRNKVSEYYKQAAQTNPNANQSGPTSMSKGDMDSSTFVAQALSTQKANYNDVVGKTPAGQIPVLQNSDGQIGYIPANEFDDGEFTKL